MKAAWIGGLIVIGLGVILVPATCRKMEDDRLKAEFEAELKLAHKAGLSLTAAEFEASWPQVKPEENAAPTYRKMTAIKMGSTSDARDLLREITFHPTPASKAKVQKLLQEKNGFIDLAREAGRLPHCRFDRDWNDGVATLMPEYAYMKGSALFLLLEGAVNPDLTFANAKLIRKMNGHLREEPHELSQFVADSIESQLITQLANWAFLHPKDSRYRTEMKAVIEEMREPNLKAERRFMLFEVLSLVELTATPEGRAKLGLREDEDTAKGVALAKAFESIQSRHEAKVKIVRSIRTIYNSLDLPLDKMGIPIKEARHEMFKALISFPLAGQMVETFTSPEDDPEVERIRWWKTRRIRFLALSRALESPTPPKSIWTDDLLSPYDGKPLQYKFDGKTMTFTVPGSTERPLTIPPPSPPDSSFRSVPVPWRARPAELPLCCSYPSASLRAGDSSLPIPSQETSARTQSNRLRSATRRGLRKDRALKRIGLKPYIKNTKSQYGVISSMAWVVKGENRFYYRSVRIEGKVRRIYCGMNEAADIGAAEHKKEQQDRKARIQRRKEEWAKSRCYRLMNKEIIEESKKAMEANGYSRSRRGIWRPTTSSTSSPKPTPETPKPAKSSSKSTARRTPSASSANSTSARWPKVASVPVPTGITTEPKPSSNA